MHRTVFAWTTLATLVAACGGATTTDLFEGNADAGAADSGPADGGSPIVDSGFSDGGLVDSGPHSACPGSAPADRTACTGSLSCEYGGVGEHGLCSTIATCVQGRWSVILPDSKCVGSQASNPSSCPSSFNAPTAGSCPGDFPRCVYPEGECACTACANANGTDLSRAWFCEKWPAPQGCPEPRPWAGAACTTNGQACDYGSPCGVTSQLPFLTCADGAWKISPSAADCALPRCTR